MMPEKQLNKVKCISIFLYQNLNLDMAKKTGIFLFENKKYFFFNY